MDVLCFCVPPHDQVRRNPSVTHASEATALGGGVRKKPPLTPVLRRAGNPRIAPVRVQGRVGVCSVSTKCPRRV